MAIQPHPKPTSDIVPSANEAAAPREGTEPAADSVPFHGGGYAKKGGAYPGGYVQPEEPPPPEADATKTVKAPDKTK
jgi:hypothetical protein